MPFTKAEKLINGSDGMPVAIDITFDEAAGTRPVVVYAHGFNGFKDWGNFDLIAAQFVAAGFTFVKFNFSHNGTSPEHPQDFVDLEAFGNNNYTKELYDLGQVIDWVCSPENPFTRYLDPQRTGLIGHSMGGGISIIHTAEDNRIKALATWASVSVCKTPWGSWPEDKMKAWQASGVAHYLNGRTNQQMPMYYQLFLDYKNNADRLDIIKAAGAIHVPFLICHGTGDSGVKVSSAHALHQAKAGSQLFLIASDHVFGRKHPWTETTLPEPMQQVCDRNISFFKESLTTNRD